MLSSFFFFYQRLGMTQERHWRFTVNFCIFVVRQQNLHLTEILDAPTNTSFLERYLQVKILEFR